MRTVYAVSSGSYSDYRIDFLCEDKAEAERYVKLKNHPYEYGDSQVEEMEFYPSGETPKQTLTYYARIGSEDVDVRVTEEYVTGDTEPITAAKTFGPWRQPDNSPTRWSVEVRGTDRDRVVKAARDRAAKVKAEVEGVA